VPARWHRVFGAAPDVHRAGPGDGGDHGRAGDVRDGTAVRDADGGAGGGVRGDGGRGLAGQTRSGARRALTASCQLLLRQGCEGAGGGP
jgi:hypothetical protein